MPKLKVPGETHKPRPHGKKGSGERKLLLKSRSNNEKVVVGGGGGGGGKKSLLLGKRRNGTVKVPLRPRRDFYKTFGASDDEELEWEGFTSEDVENGDKEVAGEEMETIENGQPMETDSPDSPVSPLFASPLPKKSHASSSNHTPMSTHGPFRRLKRGTRCMECKACRRENDCGKCMNCLDKPKFGGPGSRKQACIHRKCTNLIRDVPLKSTQSNKRGLSDSHLPPSKRLLREDGGGPLPLRPRRILHNKTKDDQPLIQLYWPDNVDSGCPVYLFSPSTSSPSPPPSPPLPPLDVCKRCGSVGLETLLYCQVCCQPYHWFCANVSQTTPTFTCQMCVSCIVCGKPDKCIKCCDCKEWYHPDCLLGHTSLPRDDNKEVWKCIRCTKCISCHSNLPIKTETQEKPLLSSLLAPPTSWCDGYCYCSDCYALKAKGNSCPVCGECYLDNDFDSKMVQCIQCDNWVHSHCENMTDEEYEILSDLPDSVEYVCRLCTASNNTVKANERKNKRGGVVVGGGEEEEEVEWRAAVNKFKHESYEKIISSLKTALGSIWVNDINVLRPLVSVGVFAGLITDQLGKCSKGVKTGSHKHRLLFSSQKTYNKELEEAFPWFNSENGDEKKEAQPTDTPTADVTPPTRIEEWPSTVSHDHSYLSRDLMSHDKSICIKQEVKRSEERKEETKETEKETKKSNERVDDRVCLLCTSKGDQPSLDAGRLLPCGGVEEWAHVNCALWSAEVYEDTNGYLCSVHTAIGRGLRLKCDLCHLYGATVGCCHSSCSSNYHYMCARKKRCTFLNNKEVYCHQHSSLCDRKETVPDDEMKVDRCIIIHTDNDRPGRKFTKSFPPQNIKLRIGSLLINSLGILTPLSDTLSPSLLISHNFSSSSLFWSTAMPTQRTSYTLTISAELLKEEPLPITLPTPETPPTSPEDPRWPCTSALVGSDEGVWSSVSSLTQILSSPSLINNNISTKRNLKASENFPETALKIFRIPKKTSSSSPPPLPQTITLSFTSPKLTTTRTTRHTNQHHRKIQHSLIIEEQQLLEEREGERRREETAPLDSHCLQRLELGLPTNVNGIHYEIKNDEGQSWNGSDLKVIWQSVISELQDARLKLDLPFIPFSSDSVYNQFGLSHDLVLQLLEQLPGQEKCSRHDFLFYQPDKVSSWQQTRVIVNRTGCARSEGYNGVRSEPDMFSFLKSQWRPDPPEPDLEALDMAVIQAECQGTSNTRHQPQNDVPVAMRYRACQRTYRESVGVFGSHIHGLGLFCLQEIDSGDMVIEYAGTVIRSTLTDYRERFYESKGIGCYMFRIDSDEVVDATMSGNMARFINHSCEPNCYSKVVAVDGQKKIMIFALRKIVPGEELTYDYKFPIEEAKIPCKCGSARCRKTLN